MMEMDTVYHRIQGLEPIGNLVTYILVISGNFVNQPGVRFSLEMCPLKYFVLTFEVVVMPKRLHWILFNHKLFQNYNLKGCKCRAVYEKHGVIVTNLY